MKISLRIKTVLLIILVALILSTAGILISSQAFRQIVDETYRSRVTGVANTVAAVVDAAKVDSLNDAVLNIYRRTDEKVTSDAWGTPEFDSYIANYASIEESEEFQSLREQLRKIQDVNEVDCVYLLTVDKETESTVYLVDAAYEDACPPGCIDPLYEENRELLTNPARGFPPYITNSEPYGWLISAGTPIYDHAGEVITYAMVDIQMKTVRDQQSQYVLVHALSLAALTLIVCIAAIWFVERSIIRPINLLSNAAAHYDAEKGNAGALENLPIRTNDEIQSLYSSVQQMVQDIRDHIDNLMKTTQELNKTRIKADEMDELAHRDALTGIGSKLAYDQMVQELTEEMRQGAARFGIVMVDMNDLKWLNDTYGHEKGNVAIRKTCAVLCDVFKHSPVYRFGGDEFVVVVRNRDYDEIETRVQEFRNAANATTGEPWERVNAAVGYALYNGDDTVEDVFRRADHVMYEQKKEMKRTVGRRSAGHHTTRGDGT